MAARECVRMRKMMASIVGQPILHKDREWLHAIATRSLCSAQEDQTTTSKSNNNCDFMADSILIETTNDSGGVKQARESVDKTVLWLTDRRLVRIDGLERATTLQKLHVTRPINAFQVSNLTHSRRFHSVEPQPLRRRASVCARANTARRSRREARSLPLVLSLLTPLQVQLEPLVVSARCHWPHDDVDRALGENCATAFALACLTGTVFQLVSNRLHDLPRELGLLRSLRGLWVCFLCAPQSFCLTLVAVQVHYNALECVPGELADLQALRLLNVRLSRSDALLDSPQLPCSSIRIGSAGSRSSSTACRQGHTFT
jgi:hypothetical protein